MCLFIWSCDHVSLQIFMCFMWILLQFAVMLMYWDIPPQDLTNHREASAVVVEEEVNDDDDGEEGEDEEGKPLVGTQESLGSYGTLPNEPVRAVANGKTPHEHRPDSPEPQPEKGSPLKLLSASKGEGSGAAGGVRAESFEAFFYLSCRQILYASSSMWS